MCVNACVCVFVTLYIRLLKRVYQYAASLCGLVSRPATRFSRGREKSVTQPVQFSIAIFKLFVHHTHHQTVCRFFIFSFKYPFVSDQKIPGIPLHQCSIQFHA
uniref:Uncharacterized protein n=1 Tax=Anguilla anguilla TaxID=7936 RepID=A0A0E9WW65_ANGAN